MKRNQLVTFSTIIILVLGCENLTTNIVAPNSKDANTQLFNTGNSTTEDFDYWYHNDAEITSYKLTQARYGELHEGTATFIFVTEPFSPNAYTKADENRSENIAVLKHNQTRKFYTGIYPYSIMSSSFFPFKKGNNSIKLSSSIQEWCGQAYMELRNNKSNYMVSLNSYFEGETYHNEVYVKALLEDDVWAMIRIRKNLPEGNLMMYPSMISTGLMHYEYKPYKVETTLLKNGTENTYKIYYPELERTLSINFEAAHPHKITGWEENFYSGFGENRKKLTTTATRMKIINSKYWDKNSVADSTLRNELNL